MFHELETVSPIPHETWVRLPTERAVELGRLATPPGTAGIELETPMLSRRHSAILPKAGGFVVVDRGSAGGTYVNDVKIAGEHRLVERDLILPHGTFIMFHAGALALEPIEEAFIAAMDHEEALRHDAPGSRVVYADWLEQRGQHLRAELLRYRAMLDDPDTSCQRLREIFRRHRTPGVADIQWLLRVLRYRW